MDISSPVHRSVKKVSFSFLTAEQVRRQSIKAITNPATFDALNHPIDGGLYDPTLGPVERGSRCRTCGLGQAQCPGHFGHIELCLPVYNPLTFTQMYQLLRLTCLYCHRLRIPVIKAALIWGELKLLQAGRLMEAMDLEPWYNHQEQLEIEAATAEAASSNAANASSRASEDEMIKRIQTHVSKILAAPSSSTGPATKSGLLSEYRRKLINNFLKKVPTGNQCQHCRGYIPGLHRHANTKIFLNPLRRGMAAVMELKKMSPDAIFEAAIKEAESSGAESRFRPAEIEDDSVSAVAGNEAAGEDEPMLGGADDDESDAGNAMQVDADEEDDDILKAKKEILATRSLKPGSRDHAADAEGLTANDDLKYMTPLHVFEHLKLLFEREGDLLRLIFQSQDRNIKAQDQAIDHRLFFTQVLAVTPNRFRPPSMFGDSSFDHPQNGYLAEILRVNAKLIELGAAQTVSANNENPNFSKLIEGWVQLQEQVNFYFDSSRNTNVGMGQIPPAGIKQILEKKEGLFRKHMMGKRVNFAARSVISPDPNLDVGEIGVPLVFAKKLTYPEPVTAYNLAKLQAAVINGPERYPGASHVQLEDGTLQALEGMKPAARKALAAQLHGKKVLRNLEDGDLVLMNRQPTLHKPSMMAHRVRVLHGEKTLRMHYANCDAYNADFDGDEMNLHFPQNELARAELASIAATEAQYLVPTDGSPLRGLIQDHVVTGVILTLKDSFLTVEQFQQLLFSALPESLANSPLPLLIPAPAIQRPVRLWTGKQLIAAVIANMTRDLPPLNLTSKCKASPKLWTPSHVAESQVFMLDGYLVHGVMDKSQFGASSNGITHACYELYGGAVAGTVLSVMSRLFTRWDQMNGFTCRMDDLLLTPEAEQTRKSLFAAHANTARETAYNFVKTALAAKTEEDLQAGLERVVRDEDLTRGLDGAMKVAMNGVTSRVIEATLPQGQQLRFPNNNMSLMTLTGAKGSMVNFSQISGCLGQQELEGRRVPAMVSGRTLPAFEPFCTEARAGGYIAQRFLTGIRPAEFYFHCMAGREGLIDTAVKTSRSGYLQRCLIKHLETLRVHYDHTVRSDDHSVVQFAYGEDGIDVVKQSLLDPSQLQFCANNFSALLQQCQPQAALLRLPQNAAALKAASKARKKPHKYSPVLSQFSPACTLGATSERFYNAVEDFIDAHPENFVNVEKDKNNKNDKKEKKDNNSNNKNNSLTGPIDANQFRALMWLKYMRSLAEPGEAVGLLAAQSLGEPSTQMTLNTFHFAGFGAKNVTLGIPRLREIIMTASPNLKTPSMTLTLAGEWARDQAKAVDLSQRLSRLTMKNVLQEVTVTEKLVSVPGEGRKRVYSVVLEFIPTAELAEHYACTVQEVRRTVESSFVMKMQTAIEKVLKQKGTKRSGAAGFSAASPDELISVTKARVEAITGEGSGSSRAGRKGDADAMDAAEDVDEESGSRGKSKNSAKAAEQDSSSEDDEPEIDEEGFAPSKRSTSYSDDEEGNESGEETTAAVAATGPSAVADGTAATIESSSNDLPPILRMKNVQNYNWLDEDASVFAAFDLVYSAAVPKFLLLDVIERISGDVVIRHIPGLAKAHLMPPEREGQPYTISTEGINFAGVLDAVPLEAIDHTATTSNSIHAILETYGVEAARAAIVHEISAVFAVYGISIDSRHMSLIADYMTQEGGYRAFNRSGMENVASPFLKMTFETTVQYLKNATLIGETDELISPASRIVMGLPVALGTGSFEIRAPI